MVDPSIILCRACANCAFHVHASMPEASGVLNHNRKDFKCIKQANPAMEEHPLSLAERVATDNPADLHPIDQMAQFCDHYRWGPLTYPMFRKEALKRLNTDYVIKSPARLALKFERWYRPGEPVSTRPRVKVFYYTRHQHGTVAMSAGPEPVMLLMRNLNQRGSWVILEEDTPVIAEAWGLSGAERNYHRGTKTHHPYQVFDEETNVYKRKRGTEA